MIHGMIGNGKIFYHHSGKGLGPYLAERGFDVYVADLRGIGESTPAIGPASEHGQTETVRDDLPLLIDEVLRRSKAERLHLVAHSWGGVVLNAAMARRPDLIPHIRSSVYFGSKRRVRAQNPERWFKIDLVWRGLGSVLVERWGFLDAVKLGLGSDNETAKTHRQCTQWIVEDGWVDSDDGFDVAETLRFLHLPPTWYIAAANDYSLGHPDDVRLLMNESGPHIADFTLLSKANGNAANYDHISMLTDAVAKSDHFTAVVTWLEAH